MPISPPTWTRQNRVVLSMSAVWTELATREDNFQVFSSPWYIWDWTVAIWKVGREKTELLSCRQSLLCSHRTYKTRQDSLVLSVSAMWTLYTVSPRIDAHAPRPAAAPRAYFPPRRCYPQMQRIPRYIKVPFIPFIKRASFCVGLLSIVHFSREAAVCERLVGYV